MIGIVSVGSIIIVCLLCLLCVAYLLWKGLQRWDGIRAVLCILSSFILAHILLSYFVVVIRSYYDYAKMFWEYGSG